MSSDAGWQEPRAIIPLRGGCYRAYWDDHIVGDFDCYLKADMALDDYELSLLRDGLIDRVPVSIYARPAEPAAPLYACPCMTDPDALPVEPHALAATFAAPAFSRASAHDLRPPRHAIAADAWWCGAHVFWVDPGYTPLTCTRCEAPATPLIDAGPSVCSSCGAPSDPGAALTPELPLCAACGGTMATRLLCVILSGGPRCPECSEPVAEAGVWCKDCACPSCGGAHRGWQCPEITKLRNGMDIWASYIEGRAAFLKVIQWADAQRLALMGEAVAFYLTTRMGGELTPDAVLTCWAREIAAQAH